MDVKHAGDLGAVYKPALEKISAMKAELAQHVANEEVHEKLRVRAQEQKEFIDRLIVSQEAFEEKMDAFERREQERKKQFKK